MAAQKAPLLCAAPVDGHKDVLAELADRTAGGQGKLLCLCVARATGLADSSRRDKRESGSERATGARGRRGVQALAHVHTVEGSTWVDCEAVLGTRTE